MTESTHSESSKDQKSTQASEPRRNASYFLTSLQQIEAALLHHINECKKFVNTPEAERTAEGARRYATDAKAAAELWIRIPRRRRRQLDKNRFSKLYKDYLNFKNLQDVEEEGA